jgi:hypothetical protein
MTVRHWFHALLAVLLVGSSACASAPPQHLVALTQELRAKYSLSDEDVLNLQYYVSSAIVLQRELSSGGVGVTPGHTLRVVNDKKVEEVIIEPKTPGVATRLHMDGNSIDASFEEGRVIVFCTTRPNGGHGDLFRLCGRDGENSVMKVDYGGLTYITAGRSTDAYLMIDLNALNNFKKNTRVVKGRRLPT